jgi:uncharacterized protein (DUF1501 family)
MERRNFLKLTGTLGASLSLGGQSIFALNYQHKLSQLVANHQRKLVLIQLDGGNDGLNTLVPMNQYSNLLNARSNVIIPENNLLLLENDVALHPSLSHLRDLYLSKKLMFIQGVGYPKPNLSHFRSKEIILSASDSNVNLNTGWFGRSLQDSHQAYPVNYPNATYPHPLALSIGVSSSPTCQGVSANFSTVIKTLNSSYSSIEGNPVFPDNYYGDQMKYISAIMDQTEKYLTIIKSASQSSANLSLRYPATGQNTLADQLKIVANLIAGGLETQIYIVSLGGFDTHANQATANNPLAGKHADLLFKLSQGIEAFQDDLSLMGVEDEVIGLVYTEFGRRIKSNTSTGTDHGTSWPAMLFGSLINPVIYGSNPVIPVNAQKNDNLSMQFDFRSVYASIYKHWFEASDMDINETLLGEFNYLPILKNTPDNNSLSPFESELKLYPYLCENTAYAEFISTGGNIRIFGVYSDGRFAKEFFNGKVIAGPHKISLDLSNLATGILHIRITGTKEMLSGKVFKTR